MELFILDENYLVQLNQEWIQLHEPFRFLYLRDKGNVDKHRKETGRYKAQAHKEFTFIYHYQDYRSKLINYDDAERFKQSIKDADLPENWKPDKYVEAALQKYKELQDCRELRLLRAAYKTIDTAIKQLNDLDEVTPETFKLLQEVPKIIKQLTETEKMVKSALQANPNSRGDVEIGINEL